MIFESGLEKKGCSEYIQRHDVWIVSCKYKVNWGRGQEGQECFDTNRHTKHFFSGG